MCHFPRAHKLPSREGLTPRVLTVHRGVTSVVCVGPQPFGNSVSMMKGKHTADQDLEICSRSKVAPLCNKLPAKSPQALAEAWLFDKVQQAAQRAPIKRCLWRV